MKKKFLTAAWKNLIMANYVVDPKALQPFVPEGTELDLWNGKCYVSLVGFMFLNTKIKGIPIPFHRNFEEVNLRFYVRYYENGEWKRGVTFLKEIVPKAAITFVANTIYGENYTTFPMKNRLEKNADGLLVEYSWKTKEGWNDLQVLADPNPQPLVAGSETEFITQHYWGYAMHGSHQTNEYQVEHPSWRIFNIKDYHINYLPSNFYGAPFDDVLKQKPDSIFMAEGSDIIVRDGQKLAIAATKNS